MGTMNARTRERDEAIAENERLRAQLANYTERDPDDIYAAPTQPTPPSDPPESGETNDDEQVPVHVVTDAIYTAMQRKSDLVDGNGVMMLPASVARKFAADQESADPLEQQRANFQREAAEYMDYLKSQS